MARYLVIEFDSNDAAAAMADKIMNASRGGALFRVVGMFVKPGRTCECNEGSRGLMTNYKDPTKERNSGAGVILGTKFGWWVCTVCKKPRKAGHQLVNQLLPSQTFHPTNSVEVGDYEFTVTSLGVGSTHRRHIDRPKKLRKLRKVKKHG